MIPPPGGTAEEQRKFLMIGLTLVIALGRSIGGYTMGKKGGERKSVVDEAETVTTELLEKLK